MEPILKIKNLQKYYHDTKSEIEAIKNITLDIYANSASFTSSTKPLI